MACRAGLKCAAAVWETSAGDRDVTERAVKGWASLPVLNLADRSRTTSRLRTAPASEASIACRAELERATAVWETSAGDREVTERAVKGCAGMTFLAAIPLADLRKA